MTFFCLRPFVNPGPGLPFVYIVYRDMRSRNESSKVKWLGLLKETEAKAR